MQSNKLVIILVTLSLIQTSLIVYLLASSSEKSPQTEYVEPSESISSDLTLPLQIPVDEDHNNSSTTATNNIVQSELRNIIRQELALFAKEKSAARGETLQNNVHQFSSEEDIARVNEQFDVFLASGEVSRQNIENFYVQVSKLSPRERKQTLNRIAKSVNQGLLKITQ